MTPAQIVEKVNRRVREAAAQLTQGAVERRLLPGHTAYRRFIIVATIRTGSTMLCSYLGSHPNARVFFELFHRYPHSVPFDHLGYRARGNEGRMAGYWSITITVA